MHGGTTFHFVDGGIEAALEQAFDAADGRLGGGVAAVQQYLRAGMIDDLHVVIVPILLDEASGCSTIWTVGRAITSVSSS